MSVTHAHKTVVLITGCSKGSIGYALAEEFTRYGGCQVVATARKPERMAGLEPLGCKLLKLDITNMESVKDVVQEVIKDQGRIDVLVNNAGAALRGAVLDVPNEAVQKLFEVNFIGQLNMIREVAPHMIKQRSGTVMNIGSAAGMWPTPFLSAYSASKAALQAISDSLRVELQPFGVHVVHVAAGFIKTNIFSNAAEGQTQLPDTSFYKPIEDFIKTDIFKTIGLFPVDATSAARHLVKQALQHRPPAVAYVGRWSWNTWFCSHYVPHWVLDLLAYYSHALYKLTGTDTQQQRQQQEHQEHQEQQQEQRQEDNGDAAQDAAMANGDARSAGDDNKDMDSKEGASGKKDFAAGKVDVNGYQARDNVAGRDQRSYKAAAISS